RRHHPKPNRQAHAEIPITPAEVGDIAPRDVSVASTTDEQIHRAILGFNVEVLGDAKRNADESEVRVFRDDVIYQLV
ncbi:translation initiation factor IF-2, partial [Halalkalicoccus sp. NIPERK01]|nr:translation initiation factor IF-2 [Halalkalicoccus sp. NIPERK01]